MTPSLPPPFDQWFQSRGWLPHDHQIAMLEAAAAGRHVLLIAPTGGGKTLAGFLPSLIDAVRTPPQDPRTKVGEPRACTRFTFRR